MRGDEDGVLIVRAELSQRLATLQRLSRGRRPHEFLQAVQAMRDFAEAYHFTATAQLADALGCLPLASTSGRAVALYLDRLHDAIACGRGDPRACEALMASVSVRMAHPRRPLI